MTEPGPIAPNSVHREDLMVVMIGHPANGPEVAQLGLACRFYGFRLVLVSAPGEITPETFVPPGGGTPVLLVVHAACLAVSPATHWQAAQAAANRQHLPIAVVGIVPETDSDRLAGFADGSPVRAIPAGPAGALWVNAVDPTVVGFELRGLGLRLGLGAAHQLELPPSQSVRIVASVGPTATASRPAMVQLERNRGACYLLARLIQGEVTSGTWQFDRTRFGEVAQFFLLLRETGGGRCWQAPAALANLTIDDPWLTEPYGCLSYPGLLAEMQRERFHATIAFVPWNYDRASPRVVDLFRAQPDFLSIAVHGNNHDRYEFYRYETGPGDRQRAKPLAEQAFNVRQALARMEAFEHLAGVAFDRVMVFPHGVCPAATFGELKRRGYWATSNYSNVPLGEKPPPDPAVALRGANDCWSGFAALRRAYPEKYPEVAIAIDLFLGNPVLFMAHQDNFFDGIDAFNAYARKVNVRQPAVRWASLGEISRHLHLLRWPDENHCEVRLVSRLAKIENPRAFPVEFHLAKSEPAPSTVQRITVDGVETDWATVDGEVRFATTLAAGATGLVEIQYLAPVDSEPVPLRRRGLRNRALRLISDFRDLTLSRSVVGRFLTRKYYRPKKKL